MLALKESNDLLLEIEAKRSPFTKQIIESRQEYLRRARAWTEIGEKAYLDSVVN